MSFVWDLIELIITQPGALVYHLVTLFAIQLIAGVAIGHWQRQRNEAATRLFVMSVGIFLARAILMVLGVLARTNLVSAALLFPPLERFLQFLTSLLLIWAFLPVLEQRPRLGTSLLVVGTIMAAGAYAASASLWPQAKAAGSFYSSTWQERIWELSTAATLGLALVTVFAWRGADWGWTVCLLALLLTGHVLQLVAPVLDAHSAPWVRLASLAGLPLLAGLVYRRALRAAASQADEEGHADQTTVDLLRAVRRIGGEGELKVGLELAMPVIAKAMDADCAAAGLIISSSAETLRIVAAHSTAGLMVDESDLDLPLSDYPLLAAAVRSRRPKQVLGDHETAPQVSSLYRHLGFQTSGPLVVQPLVAGDDVVGLLLVGNPLCDREWTTHEGEILEGAGMLLACAIASEGHRRTVADL